MGLLICLATFSIELGRARDERMRDEHRERVREGERRGKTYLLC